MMRRVLGAAFVAASFTLAACGGGGDTDAADEARTLHRGNSAEPLSLDPHKAQGTWENNIIGDMFVGLFTETADGQPEPGMAETWEISEDGLTWTFTLKDATWSDGVPVTADDFVFAMRRILNPETLSQYAGLLHLIAGAEGVHLEGAAPDTLGVRAIDDKTLEINLVYPAPYLPGLLTHYTTFPVPAHVVEEFGDQWISPENIQVNGPYKLAQWRINDFVRVERNPLYEGADDLCFAEVFYYPTNDTNSAERQVRSGEIDLNNEFPGQRIDFFREQIPDYVNVAAALSTTYLAFNSNKEPFGDARVRQALTMVIDKQFIVDEILRAGQVPAYALVPPTIASYGEFIEPPLAPWAGEDLQERRARAVTMLEEAGFGPENPLRFEYQHRNTADNPRVAPALVESWSSLAPWISVDTASVEAQIHYEDLRTGDFEVGDAGWVADYNDPQNFLYLLSESGGPMNYSEWINPEYERLMAASSVERDPAARAELLADAEALMLAEAPVAPLWHQVNKSLVNPQINGWVENAVRINRTRHLCREGLEPLGADEVSNAG